MTPRQTQGTVYKCKGDWREGCGRSCKAGVTSLSASVFSIWTPFPHLAASKLTQSLSPGRWSQASLEDPSANGQAPSLSTPLLPPHWGPKCLQKQTLIGQVQRAGGAATGVLYWGSLPIVLGVLRSNPGAAAGTWAGRRPV